MLPSTAKIEEKENKLLKEYEEIQEFQKSDELNTYLSLKDFVHSDEFKRRKKEINAQRYEDTEAWQKEKRYLELKKLPKIKAYLKLKDSEELRQYNQVSESEKFNAYKELEGFFNSSAFDDFKTELKQKKQDNQKKKEDTLRKFNALKKQLKWFFNFQNSENLKFYKDFQQSDILNEFLELEDEVKHMDFKEIKREYKQKGKDAGHDAKDDFEHSPEYQTYTRYKELKNNPEIKKFLKLKGSKKIERYYKTRESAEIKEFKEIENYLESPEYENLNQEIEKLSFENTQEYENYQKFKELSGDGDIKKALKFENSKLFNLYQSALNSKELDEFNKLRDYLESDEFKELKTYMKTSDKFKHSEEFKQLQEFKKLEKSENIQWYYKRKDAKDFDFFRKWSRSFYDDFEEGELDRNKWITTYFWGKNLLQDSYAQSDDMHLFTNGHNLDIQNSVLSIMTRNEEVEGKSWHPKFGFYPRKFQYTSGMINTAESFRQKYGIFKAKVRIGDGYPLKHAFWMVPDRISPEIDVFSFHKKSPRKVQLSNYWGEINSREGVDVKQMTLKGPDFSKDFYIFSLEWTPEELIWKINGITVKKEKKGIPDQPLYLIFNSGLQDQIDTAKLPGQMEIDWVVAYKAN